MDGVYNGKSHSNGWKSGVLPCMETRIDGPQPLGPSVLHAWHLNLQNDTLPRGDRCDPMDQFLSTSGVSEGQLGDWGRQGSNWTNGVFHRWGYPNSWMLDFMENPRNGWFRGTPISGNHHVWNGTGPRATTKQYLSLERSLLEHGVCPQYSQFHREDSSFIIQLGLRFVAAKRTFLCICAVQSVHQRGQSQTKMEKTSSQNVIIYIYILKLLSSF